MTPYTLQSYLPLYLGQKIRYKWHEGPMESALTIALINYFSSKAISDIQLILRPLSSMTEEEKLELYTMGFTHNKGMQILHPSEWKSFTPEQFKKLLEWGLDIFRLKEKGLCLYPEELK